jgi:GT2 family glycosyltransferase
VAHLDVVVLNYNGKPWLAECLPSVVHAAQCSRHQCTVVVIDNDSTDDSRRWLAEHFPQVEVRHEPNRGLCSINRVLAGRTAPIAVLLNNDVKLRHDALDPLVAPLVARLVAPREIHLLEPDTNPKPSSNAQLHGGPQSNRISRPGDHPNSTTAPAIDSRRCFMTAPLCWRFDGQTYEGQKTAVQWRWGLVQATSHFAGHESGIHVPGLTASAGAALAVDRRVFLELGGFDPLYLPGRIEDLDLCFRAYQAGYRALHVPQAIAWHWGAASFESEFGSDENLHLALRNTLLFQWKNLRSTRHVVAHLAAMPLRLLRDLWRAPRMPAQQRWAFSRAWIAALKRWRMHIPGECPAVRDTPAERRFFREFAPQAMRRRAACATSVVPSSRPSVAVMSSTAAMPSVATSDARAATTVAPSVAPSPAPCLLSVCIITHQERNNLEALLPRLDWADEIVVVDGGSTDGTPDVARRLGARVIRRTFDNFAQQRNAACRAAQGTWILSLDADERPSPDLRREILRRIRRGRHNAYRVPIRSTILGRAMRYGGTQDDRPVRLFRKDAACWEGAVHERLSVVGSIGLLTAHLEHYTLPDLASFLIKIQRYTSLAAETAPRTAKPPSNLYGLWRAGREIARRMIYKSGLLDGPRGWLFCFLSGLSEWVLVQKQRRIHRARQLHSRPLNHATDCMTEAATHPLMPRGVATAQR